MGKNNQPVSSHKGMRHEEVKKTDQQKKKPETNESAKKTTSTNTE